MIGRKNPRKTKSRNRRLHDREIQFYKSLGKSKKSSVKSKYVVNGSMYKKYRDSDMFN